jgi:UDP-N-acetylmuramyl tripeptide synthase
VRTLVDAGKPARVLVALNDAIADGRDVSWIWDVDFEPLLEGLDKVIVSGSRAEELALRFRYAGVAPERINLVKDLGRALTAGIDGTPSGGELVVLPTYTAMLALRRIAVERGLVRPYWEEAA